VYKGLPDKFIFNKVVLNSEVNQPKVFGKGEQRKTPVEVSQLGEVSYQGASTDLAFWC